MKKKKIVDELIFNQKLILASFTHFYNILRVHVFILLNTYIYGMVAYVLVK